MSDDTEVSVVIPTYNRAHCVGMAIESALAQHHASCEIIVIDDGSVDDTARVIAQFGDSVRSIRQSNAGVSAARNTGIEAARGKWVALLDSDDQWRPGKLDAQLAQLNRNQHLVAHVTNGTVLRPRDEIDLFSMRGIAARFDGPAEIERPLADALACNFFTPAYVVRRDILMRAGLFDESFSVFEDMDLFARVALHGPWGVDPRPFVKICSAAGKMGLSVASRRDPVATRRVETLVLEKLRGDPRVREGEQRMLERRLSGARYALGIEQMKARERADSRRSIIQSMRDDPGLRAGVRGLSALVFGPAPGAAIQRARSRGREEFPRPGDGDQT